MPFFRNHSSKEWIQISNLPSELEIVIDGFEEWSLKIGNGLAQSLFMSQKIGDHMYLPSTKWIIFTRKLVNIMDACLDLPTNQLSQLSPIWVDLGQIDCDLNPKLHHGFWFLKFFFGSICIIKLHFGYHQM